MLPDRRECKRAQALSCAHDLLRDQLARYHKRFVLAVSEGETMMRGLAMEVERAARRGTTDAGDDGAPQEYPSKPVVVIVPAAAGADDTRRRSLGVAMGARWGSNDHRQLRRRGGIIGINKPRSRGPTATRCCCTTSACRPRLRCIASCRHTVNDFEYIRPGWPTCR